MYQSPHEPPSRYRFALHEGPNYRNDPFDYRLMIFHNTCSENLHTPLPPQATQKHDVPVFMKMATVMMSPPLHHASSGNGQPPPPSSDPEIDW